ncbi:DUF6233 domain-containing protein [Streptomyces sp. NPDC048258]|uniref:DUF6233 domain-containing protein n=1 Tax=Streptomyces sp. NPDC048258 TaxID=3365527 RepID=UPI0037180B70
MAAGPRPCGDCGDCGDAGMRCPAPSSEEARRAPAEGLPACLHCRPDAALGCITPCPTTPDEESAVHRTRACQHSST